MDKQRIQKLANITPITEENIYISDTQKKESKKNIDNIIYSMDRFMSRFNNEVDKIDFELSRLGVSDNKRKRMVDGLVGISKLWSVYKKNIDKLTR